MTHVCFVNTHLKHFVYNALYLQLRQNQIKTLPEGLPGPDLPNLSLLHVSSNKLTSLPDSITQCTSLCTLYVNGNAITSLPMNGWKNMKKLKTFNVGSNNLDALPDEFVERFGEPDSKTGDCTKVGLDVCTLIYVFFPFDLCTENRSILI